MNNQDIAQMFAQIADALEVLGENRFKIQAYRRARDTIADLTVGLDTLREQGSLSDLPHIGETTARIIEEFLDHGTSALYDALMIRVPPGLLDMLRVPAIGPKTAARLYHDYGIGDLQSLYAAAREGRLEQVKGFGAKKAIQVLHAIDTLLSYTPRLRLVDALRVMDELVADIGAISAISNVLPVGSVRRGCATVGDLNLLVATEQIDAALDALQTLPQVAESTRNTQLLQVKLHNAMRVQIQVVSPDVWGAAAIWWSGSRQHIEQLQDLAQQQGWQLTPDGTSQDHTWNSEEAVYAALGLEFIVPELRENWGEIEAAQTGALPTLVQASDLRADLHWHTSWSDGRSTLADMVAAGRALGYTHMAVADHSAYLGVTGGLDGKRLKQQRAEIQALNKELDHFKLLQCCEVDILPDGSLALADEILAELDLVVASPHVALRQGREESTQRLIKAMRNPHVDIIGHPTGRLLEARAGADLDMKQIITVAAETQTALEVNAGPERLDLDGEYVRQAIEAGCYISINTDAHDPRHLAGIGLGVLTARRGWATPSQVINTWSCQELLNWIQQKG